MSDSPNTRLDPVLPTSHLETAEQLISRLVAQNPDRDIRVKVSNTTLGSPGGVEIDTRIDKGAPSKALLNTMVGSFAFAGVALGVSLIVQAIKKTK